VAESCHSRIVAVPKGRDPFGGILEVAAVIALAFVEPEKKTFARGGMSISQRAPKS